jgi:hypothetical protein
MFLVYIRWSPFEEGLYLRWFCSQPGGESRAIYSKERILSKYDRKNFFITNREDS